MRKIFIILFSALILLNTFEQAFAKDASSSSDWGENSSVFNSGFEDQKPVTDSTVQKTIEQLKQNSLSRKQKKLQKEVNPLSPMSDFEHLKDFAMSQSPDEELSQTLTVMIPTFAYSYDGEVIPPGYYKLSCRRISKDEYVLDLSQGTHLVLSLKAEQTEQDLEQDSISFCNAEIVNEKQIRLMYGSIDLNLAAYLYLK